MPSPKTLLPCLAAMLLGSASALAAPSVTAEQLRPGLVAIHRDRSSRVFTLEPVIGLHLRAGESTHPRIAPDGRIDWSGFIRIASKGKYHFDVLLRGKLTVRIAGRVVLTAAAHGDAPATHRSTVELAEGVQTFEAEFTRVAGLARLELFWQGPDFRREPLPFDVLGHLPEKSPAGLEKDRQVERGQLLVEESSCVRCHLPADSGTVSKTLRSRTGPDLTKVGQRAFPGYLESWLSSPSKWRPGTAMPAMFAPAEKAERHAVARYLSSLGGPLRPEPDKPASTDAARRGEELFTRRGCFACHVLPGKAPADKHPAARGRLYQAPRRIALAGMGSKTTAARLASYLVDPLALNEHGRMPDLMLSSKEAGDLAAFLVANRLAGVGPALPEAPAPAERLAAFKRIEARADEVKSFERLPASEQWLELGKRLVLERGCNSCHAIEPDGKPFATVLPGIDLDELGKEGKSNRGCLAEKPPKLARSPWYDFTKEQRADLIAFLRHGLQGAGSPAPLYQARLDLERFNCLACHTRHGEGGLSQTALKELRKLEKADHNESVAPPTLSGVGHKLTPFWLKEVLIDRGRARPWMPVKMPRFGSSNLGVLDRSLAALEGVDPDEKPRAVKLDAKALAAGRDLIGKGGFGCVSCHDLAGVANSGARGPDLARMNQRVRYEWYRRWLEQPQRIAPGTRMPTIFPEGKSLLDKVLRGSPDAQAKAMWGYLAGLLDKPPARRKRE
jgi:mono/diheme cytochrome c family protein